jgi:hypothetical protein
MNGSTRDILPRQNFIQLPADLNPGLHILQIRGENAVESFKLTIIE